MDSRQYHFDTDPVADPSAVVKGDRYRFTVLTERLIRYEWSPDGHFEDRASTLAVCRRFVPVPSFRIVDSDDGRLEIVTAYFRLAYDRGKPFSPGALTVTVGGDTWRYDGEDYGDLGGTARTLDASDGRVPLGPGVLSHEKPYAALDDNGSTLFAADGWVASREPGRSDGYVFAYDGDHKAAIRDFYRLTGAPPLLPRWALGNWWSRYHAYSDTDYLALMDRFSAAEIPLAVAVLDMDWHRVDDVPAPYGSGWTGYSWNRNLFPDPPRFLRQLHDRHLKVTVNDHPADGVRAFEDQYAAVAVAAGADTSHGDPVEFDSTNRRFLVDAYLDVLKLNLESQGVDFWWVDWQQGAQSRVPGIDPLWVLNHFHYLASRRTMDHLRKPIGFSRYAGPGSHRYPIGFSGDTIISWASLAFQPEFTATASNIGFGWWSHDIGGHYWGTRSDELTARWVQLGCFSPILRLHSEKSQWNSKEPWKYRSDAAAVMEKFLRFRDRLIPFLYTMNTRASYDGEPLVQPMYWNHQDDEAYTVPNQYYFGPDLIVAPITSPHSPVTLLGSVRAWLPPARYVDILDPRLIYDGGRYVQMHRTLDSLPVLAQEGTILPLDSSPISGHGVRIPTHIEVLLVVGRDAFFELIEEDESEPPAERPAEDSFIRTPIRWDQSSGQLRIGPASKPTDPSREWTVTLIGHTKPGSGLLANTSVARRDGRTSIDLGEAPESGVIEVGLGADLQLDVVDVPARLHEMLYRCESGYQMKEVIWKLVTEDDAPAHLRLARLYELDIDESLRDAVIEIWFADERSLRRGQTPEASTRPRHSSREDFDSQDYVIV